MSVDTGVEDRHFANLMQRAQAGDGDAYVQLLEEIALRVRRIVRSHWKFLGAEDVEEVLP